MLSAAAGVDTAAAHGPAKPGEQRRSCLDPTFTREHLGWSATVGFDDGVKTTLDYFRNVR